MSHVGTVVQRLRNPTVHTGSQADPKTHMDVHTQHTHLFSKPLPQQPESLQKGGETKVGGRSRKLGLKAGTSSIWRDRNRESYCFSEPTPTSLPHPLSITPDPRSSRGRLPVYPPFQCSHRAGTQLQPFPACCGIPPRVTFQSPRVGARE